MEEQVTEAEQEVIIANNNLLFYCIARSFFKKASKLRHYFLYNHVKPRHSRVQEWFVKESWKLFQETKITGKLAKPWTPKIYLEC